MTTTRSNDDGNYTQALDTAERLLGFDRELRAGLEGYELSPEDLALLLGLVAPHCRWSCRSRRYYFFWLV